MTPRILHIDTSDSDREEFFGLLVPTESLAASRLHQILSAASSTIIIENDYRDVDYTAAYGRIYHRRHHEVERRCRRLHMFESSLAASDVERELDSMSPEFAASYLGMVVIQPIAQSHLGRTLLSRKVLTHAVTGEAYLTCSAKYPINLFGNHLEINGSPWMQQDSLVAVCASAAMWNVATHMSHRFGPEFRRYTTTQITEMAHHGFVAIGRPMPSLGLTPQQIVHGLTLMGFDPLYLSPQSPEDAKRQLYHYVESGIPVILALGSSNDSEPGHAVTVVGHTLESKEPQELPNLLIDANYREEPVSLSIRKSSEFVPSFIVQDDSAGPFRVLKFVENKPVGCGVEFVDGRTPEWTQLVALIVPFPSGILLEGDEADARAVSILPSVWDDKLGLPKEGLVSRTYLQLSNDLKREWAPEQKRPNEVGKIIRRLSLPRWVWVTEIGTTKTVTDGAVYGQIIQDPASHPRSARNDDFLIWHFPGNVTIPHGEQTKHQTDLAPESVSIMYAPYKRFAREKIIGQSDDFNNGTPV